MKKKILSLVLVLCLFIPCVAMLAGCKKGSESTMSMSVNPEVSFVVDGKNKIVSVHYENEDAGTIYANVNFVGKDVDSAIQIFIEQSAISGHIDLAGDEVDIEVNGSVEKDIKALQEKAKAKVESVFANLGVEVEVNLTELTEQARKDGLVASAAVLAPEKSLDELKAMTNEELVELIKTKQKEYEGLAYDQVAAIKDQFSKAKNAVLQTIESIRASLDTLQATIEEQEAVIEAKRAEIAELGENNPLAAIAQAALEAAQTSINQANTTISEKRVELEAKINTFINNKKAEIEQAKASFEAHKADLINDYKAQVETAKTNFVNHLDTAKANGNLTEAQYNYWKELCENQAA